MSLRERRSACVYVCACMCVCECVCLWSSDEGPEPQGGWRVADSAPRTTCGCCPQAVTCSSAFLLGGAPPTMQFFKSSLILLFASLVVFCHAGTWVWPQGSAPALSEQGLQEEAKIPFWPALLLPHTPHGPPPPPPTPAFPHPNVSGNL